MFPLLVYLWTFDNLIIGWSIPPRLPERKGGVTRYFSRSRIPPLPPLSEALKGPPA